MNGQLHLPVPARDDGEETGLALSPAELEEVTTHLMVFHSFDLRPYKEKFLGRRIKKRVMMTKSGDVASYISLMKRDPTEFYRFLEALTVSTTEFFRDESLWTYLGDSVLSALDALVKGNPLSVLSAPCAAGQEPYSIAIMLEEHGRSRYSIIAVDLDDQVLEVAKKGVYLKKDVDKIPSRLLATYFIKIDDGHYQVVDWLRKKIRFQKMDMLTEKFPSNQVFDLVFCRNFCIYLNRYFNEYLHQYFHHVLHGGGFLVIGKAEGLSPAMRQRFDMVSLPERVYQKPS